MDQKEVKKFWEERAKSPNFTDQSVTNNDFYRREIEIAYIVKAIKKYGFVLNNTPFALDVGCGSGYGTKIFANAVSGIKGIDFSEEMIKLANKKNKENVDNHLNNYSFEVGDILGDRIEKEKYDIIITQRCLINLPDFETQRRAIENIFYRLKRGGIYIMLEACSNGREKLNQTRETAGLPKMPNVPFNVDFDEDELSEFLFGSRCYYEDKIYFGFYDFISRIIYPLSIIPNEPKYDSYVNKFLATLLIEEEKYLNYYKEYSRTFLYVLRKF